jgi:hypothetical protein
MNNLLFVHFSHDMPDSGLLSFILIGRKLDIVKIDFGVKVTEENLFNMVSTMKLSCNRFIKFSLEFIHGKLIT